MKSIFFKQLYLLKNMSNLIETDQNSNHKLIKLINKNQILLNIFKYFFNTKIML